MKIAKNTSLALVVGILVYMTLLFGKIVIVGFIGLALIYIVSKIAKGYKALSRKWSNFRNKE